jgi:hypothetical protein
MSSRGGSILIIVAGLAAIIAGLCLSMLAFARADREESIVLRQEVQARIMIYAAMDYVQETSRIGWHDPASSGPVVDTYGWIDVRDGRPGPKGPDGKVVTNSDGTSVFSPVVNDATGGIFFPSVGGRAARCPMHLLQRPPSAVSPAQVTNPVVDAGPTTATRTGFNAGWAKAINYTEPGSAPAVSVTDALFMKSVGYPKNPLPEPEATNIRMAWRIGDTRPVLSTVGQAWFRVYRPTPAQVQALPAFDGTTKSIRWTPAVFILAGGAGGTLGYQTYAEAVADGRGDAFQNDQASFDQIRARERILWYACEWSPAANVDTLHFYTIDHNWAWPSTNAPMIISNNQRQQNRSFGGSFLWIQRLMKEPAVW